MSFDAQKFCEDYQISWSNQGKNIGQGFIGIDCPFCDDHSFHGGFNTQNEYYSCWKCRGHWLPKVISLLAKTDIQKAKTIIQKYSSSEVHTKEKEYKYASEVIYPLGTGSLTDKAKKYLISRNFDPDHLVTEWGLLSTGNIGEYKFSILAPIHYKGKLVSYQCRDITGNSIPYKGCCIEESVYHIKHLLYGFDKAVLRKQCIVVEGLTDSWRLGPGAIATFGIQFTPQQVSLLANNFDKIFLLYDTENQAQEQADKLYSQLTIGYDKDVEILTLPEDDPGNLSNEEAKNIMKEIGL